LAQRRGRTDPQGVPVLLDVLETGDALEAHDARRLDQRILHHLGEVGPASDRSRIRAEKTDRLLQALGDHVLEAVHLRASPLAHAGRSPFCSMAFSSRARSSGSSKKRTPIAL